MINKLTQSSLFKKEIQRFHNNVHFNLMVKFSFSFFLSNILFFALIYFRTDGRGYGKEHPLIFLTDPMLSVWHSILVLLVLGISLLSLAISFAPEEKFKIDLKRLFQYILFWIMTLSIIEILVTPKLLSSGNNFGLTYIVLILQSYVLVSVIVLCVKHIWKWMLDDKNRIIDSRLKIIRTIILTIIGWFVVNKI